MSWVMADTDVTNIRGGKTRQGQGSGHLLPDPLSLLLAQGPKLL